MDPATIQIILALMPMAEKMIFQIGNKFMQVDTESLSREDLIKALKDSRAENWPDFKFVSPKPELKNV